LIAFESSGVVREAFREVGAEATSNDLLPADDGSPHHIEGDCIDAIKAATWDLIIMHPPCTAICVSGNRWYGSGMPKHAERIEAVRWTMELWELATRVCPRVAMENPVGTLPMKATQYVQPFEFGDPSRKRTGLWLHGLPSLKPTNIVEPEIKRYKKKDGSGYTSFSADYGVGFKTKHGSRRSVTFEGIASAMASQWSNNQQRRQA